MNKHLVFLLTVFTITSLTLQKGENNSEVDKKVTSEEKNTEDNKESTSTQPNEEGIPVVYDKQTKLPEAKVILPIRRIGTSSSLLNVGPCGGIIRKEANTLTNRGSNIHVVWETVIPSSNSNCTVKISPGLEREDNFTILYPTGSIGTSQGAFPCGRTKGFEGHEFILPDNYVCDKCTLQWNWSTPYGNIYSCSDIIINGEKIGNCLAKCQNGGSCFNGKCLCLEEYEGEFCQKETGSDSSVGMILFWVILSLILVGLLACGIYFLTTKFVPSWLKKQGDSPSQPFPNNKEEYQIEGNN